MPAVSRCDSGFAEPVVAARCFSFVATATAATRIAATGALTNPDANSGVSLIAVTSAALKAGLIIGTGSDSTVSAASSVCRSPKTFW